MAVSRNIVVVGAGIVGCAVAHELARRGASVDVVDMRAAGMGATQASAGILAPDIEAREASPLVDLTIRSLDLYDAFISNVSRDSGQAIPYHRTGTLNVAVDGELVRFDRHRRSCRARPGAAGARSMASPRLDRSGASSCHLVRTLLPSPSRFGSL